MSRRDISWLRRIGAQRGGSGRPPWGTAQGLSNAQRAEQAMLALSPQYQFRADTVTLNAGNVATIPNRRGADALVLAAGTLAAPTSDALFGGAQSIVFSGTQWLDSNLASSAWKFLHDGTGCEIVHVISFASVAATQAISDTRGASQLTGLTLGAIAGGQAYVRCFNASTAVLVNNAGGANTALTPTALFFNFASNAPIQANTFINAGYGSGQTQGSAPASGDPAAPFRLGATGSAAVPFAGKWCETLIFPRVLHEYERQIVREYFAARYGIAAPSLTGADRDIMSLLPFAWLDAAAANIGGGKVTAFLDRARPGHTFAQGISGNQAPTPTADALFGGKPSAVFSGAQWYDSSLPSSAWKMLHDGTGSELVHVQCPTGSGASVISSTFNNSAINVGHMLLTNAGGATHNVGNGSVTVIANSDGTSGPANAGSYLDVYFQNLAGQVSGLLFKSTSKVSTTATVAVSASNPAVTLRIGALGSGGAPASMRLAGSLVFNRVLSAADRAKMQAAILSKWGV